MRHTKVSPEFERSFATKESTDESTRVALWRARSIAFLRVAFGIVWAVAAWLKWQPKFIDSFVDTITGAKDGQPAPIQSWISWWGHLVSANPHFFAYLTATVETILAVFLIFGILTNLTCVLGFFWSLGIWSIAEGFGGPYKLGSSTDVGPALPYALLFAVLLVIAAGRYYAVDRWLTPRLGRFGILAAGPLWSRRLILA
ncbi:MAG TPA: DoxX family membrane protein [Ktedonobacteraceae bacterium]|nr:DoxX family membrane protein [Ktedonobacteraceae bacterium]